MGFQEKMAWAMAAILFVTGAAYYGWVFFASSELGQAPPPILPLLILYVVFIVIAAAGMATVIALTNPSEANARLDERERMIQFKGEAWSGRALAFLVLLGLIDFAVFQDGNRLFHVIFAALIISQIAEYCLQIFFFRRGI